MNETTFLILTKRRLNLKMNSIKKRTSKQLNGKRLQYFKITYETLAKVAEKAKKENRSIPKQIEFEIERLFNNEQE